MSVRFIHNFIITVIETYVDDSGSLRTRQHMHHVERGDIHFISSFSRNKHLVSLVFAPNDPFKGVSENIESEYCEFLTPQHLQPPRSNNIVGGHRGCGGCGHK
jgi:hypothetical protein